MCVLSAAIWAYVVLLEVAHVADDADPHQHGSGSEEDAADVVARDVLPEVQGAGDARAAAGDVESPAPSPTLFWISILRMEPTMHSMSLTMMRRYQPFTNSSLSDQGASFPLLLMQYWLYSCLRQKQPERGFARGETVATTDVSVVICPQSPLTRCRQIPTMTERVQRMEEVMQIKMMKQSKASVR